MDFLTGSNPYIPLVMRFPKTLWKDAVTFFKSVEDFEWVSQTDMYMKEE